ncbi:hypothetical protein [Evansella tamaricis]|uniref:DUF5105 domain-containing protein n=1 Tax=Evansella tamaricis TaxID=2069301 RepID=A0ABS6JC20_9BACI|nr:hypothetical protein [Evansella tamaricis]MBU9711205.1 hypothetical protein [Evansella tamaricis]
MKNLILLVSAALFLAVITACGEEEVFEQVQAEYEDFTSVSEEDILTQVTALITINNDYLSESSASGFLANRLHQSEEEKEQLEKELSQYDVTFTVDSIEIDSIEDNNVKVTVVQKEEYSNMEEDVSMEDSIVTMEYTFEIHEGILLITANEVVESMPLSLLEEVEDLLTRHYIYANEEDIESYLSTVYSYTEDDQLSLEEQFELFDVVYEVLEHEIIEFNDEEVSIQLKQTTVFTHVHEDWEAFDTLVTVVHVLKRLDGELKFYSTEIIDQEEI